MFLSETRALAKTDRFQRDAREKAIDHKVHGVGQHGVAELLQ